jgi:transposase
VQYGPRIAAIIIYLYIGQFLSKKRTAQALAELFGVPLSSGTVAAVTGRAAGRLDGFLEHARQQIAASEVAGFDETGFRVDGKLAWGHCARTGEYTLLMVHPKRGRKAIEAMGVLPSFTGTAAHDAWAPYDGYANAEHQLCCAHVLRELQAVTDAAPEGQWCWATQAAEAITAMQRLVTEAITQGGAAADPASLAAQVTRYRSAALIGASQAQGTGTPMRKHHALARRLLDCQADYLRFTTDFRIPAGNEGASYCTSWVRSAVSRSLRWSARCMASMACGTDSSGQWAAEAGVVAAA